MSRVTILPWAIAGGSVLASGGLIAVAGLSVDFVRTLVGTFVGATLGFLVALYLDRIQRTHADEVRRRNQAEEVAALRKRELAAEEREARRGEQIANDRRVAVLSLLREELGRVPDQMGQRQDRGHPPFDRLTDILWRAFSSSGELRWIEDVELLKTIASAYDLVAVEIALESRWLELRLVTGGNAPQADSFIAGQLKRHDHDAWRRACDACKALDQALRAAGSSPGANADHLFCP